MATRSVTTWDVLVGHVTLDLQCLDRIYLNEFVPNPQVVGRSWDAPVPGSASRNGRSGSPRSGWCRSSKGRFGRHPIRQWWRCAAFWVG